MVAESSSLARASDLAPLAWGGVIELAQDPLLVGLRRDGSWPDIRSKLAQAICEEDNCAFWISIPVATDLPNDLTSVVLDSFVVAQSISGTRERIQRMFSARSIDSLPDLLSTTPASLAGRKRRTLAARQCIVEALIEAATDALLARTGGEDSDHESVASSIDEAEGNSEELGSMHGPKTGGQYNADVETVVLWGKYRGHTHLRGVISALDEAPREVRDAVNRLLDSTLEDWVTPTQPSVEEVMTRYLTEHAAHRNVLKNKVGWDDDLPNASDLQAELGVSRQRVSQIAQRMLSGLEELGHTPGGRVLAWRAHELRTRLGAWAPFSLEEVRTWALPDGDPLGADAIIWLAGPYGFMQDDSSVFLQDTDVLEMDLSEFTNPDRLIDRDSLIQTVVAKGVKPKFVERLLNDWGLTWEVNGCLSPVQGNVGDYAKAVLAAHAKPMTAEEVCAEIDGGYAVSTVANRLAQDDEFVRTDVRKFGLAHWGLEEYSGIAKEIEERIIRSGGSVRVEDLVRELTSEFSIKESSVRMNLATPHFVVVDGVARLRTTGEDIVVDASISRERDTYIQDNELIWHTVIDSDLLRGSGQGFPNGAAAALRVTPGSERVFMAPEASVTVSWRSTSTTGASIGSLRGAVERLRSPYSGHISESAVLRVRFNTADETCSFELLDPVPTDSEAGFDFIARRTGLRIPSDGDALGILAKAIETPAASVKSTLIRRGDDEVADALTRMQSSRHLDAIGDRFARMVLGDSP